MDFAVYTISVKGIFQKSYEIQLNHSVKYRVKRPGFFALSELVFYDLLGSEVLKIKKHFSLFKHVFEFFQDDASIGIFEREGIQNIYFSNHVDGMYTVQGNLLGNEYTVFLNNEEIGKISSKRFRSKNKYGIAIIKGYNELYILAMVMAITMVKSRRKK